MSHPGYLRLHVPEQQTQAAVQARRFAFLLRAVDGVCAPAALRSVAPKCPFRRREIMVQHKAVRIVGGTRAHSAAWLNQSAEDKLRNREAPSAAFHRCKAVHHPRRRRARKRPAAAASPPNKSDQCPPWRRAPRKRAVPDEAAPRRRKHYSRRRTAPNLVEHAIRFAA